MRLIWCGLLTLCVWFDTAVAQNAPLRIKITQGVIEPLKFAVPAFEA